MQIHRARLPSSVPGHEGAQRIGAPTQGFRDTGCTRLFVRQSEAQNKRQQSNKCTKRIQAFVEGDHTYKFENETFACKAHKFSLWSGRGVSSDAPCMGTRTRQLQHDRIVYINLLHQFEYSIVFALEILVRTSAVLGPNLMQLSSKNSGYVVSGGMSMSLNGLFKVKFLRVNTRAR